MIIDAMGLLCTGRFTGFCIVSSESDFARLAARISKQGVRVYGFKDRKTPRPFITTCDKFVYFDVLNASVKEPATTEPTSAPAAIKKTAIKQIPVLATGVAPVGPAVPQKNKIDNALIGMLSKAVIVTADEDGWVNLGAVGSHVAKQSPEFDSRNYGFGRLSDLVEATGKFDIDRSGRTQKSVLIHLKTVPTARKK